MEGLKTKSEKEGDEGPNNVDISPNLETWRLIDRDGLVNGEKTITEALGPNHLNRTQVTDGDDTNINEQYMICEANEIRQEQHKDLLDEESLKDDPLEVVTMLNW